MIAAQRRNLIKEILLQEGSVKVAELVQKFEVSEETIRRDLYRLEDEGMVKKNYGGAVLVEELQNTMTMIPPVQQRKLEFAKEKDAIGKKAAQLVREGQIVILDSGSTTWSIAKHIKQLEDLMIVTNSIDVAEECSQSESSSIYMLGGKLVKKSMSLVGPQAESELHKYNADIVFLGTSGICLRKGFTSSDIYEAEVKRAMVAAGQKVVIVADHTKFETQSLISYSRFEEVDILVTSDLADGRVLREIEKMGVEILVGRVENKDTKSNTAL